MKFGSIFGKKGFGKGSFGGKDSSGQSIKCIGGSPTRALSPRRWGKQKGRSEQSNCIGCFPFSPAAPKKFGCAARRVPSPSGRSMIEMLAVLAIIGVLSITALVGFTYAMNKHRANETIYDVMLRGTNVPMIDEYYYDKASGYEFRFPGLVNNGRQGTYYPMTTKKDAGSSYYVEATGVTYRVCELILKMNPTDIDQIVVNNSVYTGDSDICGTTDGLAMKFCFGSDGTICDGTGQGGSSGGSGSGSSGGSGSGSGSGSDPDPDPDPDPCTLSKDCAGTKVCINGLCQDPEPNTPCVEDTDCTGDQVCTENKCEKPVPCTTTTDCPASLVCLLKVCKEQIPCQTRQDCPEGASCMQGRCDDTVPCTEASDCAAGLSCYNGQCEDPILCETDGDCPFGLICEEGTCENPDCTQDSDCSASQVCSSGRCVAKNCQSGFDCGENGCCKDGVCSSDCSPEDCCDEAGNCDPSCMCLSCEAAFNSSQCVCTNGGCEEGKECVQSCQTNDDGCVLGFSCSCELPPADGCELGQHLCFGTTASDQWCCDNGQKCGTTAEECLSCGDLTGIYCFTSITDSNNEYACTSDKEAACTACGYDYIVGTERHMPYHDEEDLVYVCGGQNYCRSGYTWKMSSYYPGYMTNFGCVKDTAVKCCDYRDNGDLSKWLYEDSGCNPSSTDDGWRYSVPCD